jgi:PIN domain nuclease of toxin-antitoxin system
MKQYILSVMVGFEIVKKYAVNQLDIAEMLAEYIRDEVTDVVIREIVLA